MRFRTKVLCVIAVPVIGLVAVGGLEATGGMSADAITITAVGTALLSIEVGMILARRVERPLQQLTEAADWLASSQLPALVDGLAGPTDDDHRHTAPTSHSIDLSADDEMGDLARAFNTIQTAAVDAAAEHAVLVRKGIGDVFVNLARRNQLLLDRQIEMFDELEAGEEDPDQLDKLYRLDHIATRMRRNAESLLVLAGVESTRRRAKPVEMLDVVRAAVGEIEDYARVDIGHFDELQVQGAAAVDLTHLLAELLENATQLSPPHTRVLVDGRATSHGYALSLTDSGIGMSPEQLAEANSLLASPPLVDFAVSRTLGLTVVAQLAARQHVTVRLAAVPTGGTAALVSLPSQVVLTTAGADDNGARLDQTPPASPRGRSAHPASGRTRPETADFDELVRSAFANEPAPADAAAWAEPDGEPEPLPQRQPRHLARQDPPPAYLSDALPQGQELELGLRMLARGDEGLGPPTLVEPVVPGAGELPGRQRPGPGEPTTAAGLVRRVPTTALSTPPPADTGPSILASNRSPEEVRSMLARYRDGLHQGQAGEVPPDPEPSRGASAPDPEENADA